MASFCKNGSELLNFVSTMVYGLASLICNACGEPCPIRLIFTSKSEWLEWKQRSISQQILANKTKHDLIDNTKKCTSIKILGVHFHIQSTVGTLSSTPFCHTSYNWYVSIKCNKKCVCTEAIVNTWQGAVQRTLPLAPASPLRQVAAPLSAHVFLASDVFPGKACSPPFAVNSYWENGV